MIASFQTTPLIFRSSFVWFGIVHSVSESGPSAARSCTVAAETSAARMYSASTLLLAGAYGIPLRRRNQSLHPLPFLLMDYTDALLFLRGGQ